jgi:trimeric autotransporter adhesin
MKKHLLLGGSLLCGLMLFAGETLYIYKGGVVSYDKLVSAVDSIKMKASGVIFNTADGNKTIDIANIDSMTFADVADVSADGNIYIIYNSDNTVEVKNPYYAAGVAISVNGTTASAADQTLSGATVIATSTAGLSDLVYHVQGTTTDGSVTFTTDKQFTLSMENANITSSTSAPICITTTKAATVKLTGSNALVDNANNAYKAALYSKAELTFDASNTGSLSVTGNKKHAIFGDSYVELDGGTIDIVNAASDGIHCDEFVMGAANLTVENTTGDCVDAENTITIGEKAGTINLTSTGDNSKGFNAASNVAVNGGTITMNLSGKGSKGIKTDAAPIDIAGGNTTINLTGTSYYMVSSGDDADTTFATGVKSDSSIYISGGILNISNAGVAGKALSTDANIVISGGTNTFTTTGTPLTVNYDNNVSSAVKADKNIEISAGTTIINVGSKASGAKGLNADGNFTMTGGSVTVTDDALFSIYTASTGADTTFVAAVKAEGNINISAGKLTCTTTQSGKGISASGNTSLMTIGTAGADNANLTINVTTKPNTSYTYTTSGDNARTKFTGKPKGIICNNGKLTVNSGTITVNSCDDGLHGYNVDITGGFVDVTSAYTGTVSSSSSSSSSRPGGQPGSSSSSSGVYGKGIHADSVLNINGGTVVVRSSYEGFEAYRINATGGVTEVLSNDDGWNASSSSLSSLSSSSSSSSSNPWGGGGMTSSSTGYLTITGGAHYVYAAGDGLDSNGDEIISGGLVVVNQNGSGGNGIFDNGDNGYTLSASGDAVILGVGTSDMSVSFSTSLNNTGYSSVSVSNGNMLYVMSGNTVLAALKVKASSSASAAIFINKSYSNVSFSTSGTASLDKFSDIDGSALFYVNTALYNK